MRKLSLFLIGALMLTATTAFAKVGSFGGGRSGGFPMSRSSPSISRSTTSFFSKPAAPAAPVKIAPPAPVKAAPAPAAPQRFVAPAAAQPAPRSAMSPQQPKAQEVVKAPDVKAPAQQPAPAYRTATVQAAPSKPITAQAPVAPRTNYRSSVYSGNYGYRPRYQNADPVIIERHYIERSHDSGLTWMMVGMAMNSHHDRTTVIVQQPNGSVVQQGAQVTQGVPVQRVAASAPADDGWGGTVQAQDCLDSYKPECAASPFDFRW